MSLPADETLFIDGQPVQAQRGGNLLDVARRNSIPIPSLCYHAKLTPTGACRLCIVKIEGQSGFVAACTVEVKAGMRVTAFDEELEEARRYLLECLLAEHNEAGADDLSYDDEFRELVARYGLLDVAHRRFGLAKQDLNFSGDESSPVLTYDASKCIKCFRCVKACSEIQGKDVLSFAGRGIRSTVVAGLGVWARSECDGCGECVQICPTGALVEKPHRNKLRTTRPERRVVTTCPYCGVGCQMEVAVINNRIVRCSGVSGLKPNDGRLCVKGRFGYGFVASPDRLKKPLVRRGDRFQEISWEAALALAAQKFMGIKANYGPDALAGFASAKCTNEDNYLFQKFIRTAFGNNNVDYCTRLCHASTVTAMLRSIGDGAGSNSIEDYQKAECILIIGNNMIETHPVTATFVKQGVAAGSRLIVIDPKWTPLVPYARIWLQPRLGTDVALLNALTHTIIGKDLIDRGFIEKRIEGGFEAFRELQEAVEPYTPEMVESITGVAAQDIIDAAVSFGRAGSAMIATGMGMSQQVTGTDNVFALINMCLICGHIGKPGSGLNPPRGQNNVQGATDVGCSPLVYPGYVPIGNDENRRKVAGTWQVPFGSLSSRKGLTTVEIIQAARKGAVKGLYIMGENPMITDPNLNHTREGLQKLEFLLVQDIFLTETARLADLVLPSTCFAEKNGTFVNSDRRVCRVRRVVDPPTGARQDWRIICDIARRMGQGMAPYRNESHIFNEIAKVTPIMSGISHRRIAKQGIQWPCPTSDHPGTPTLFLERFNTVSGRALLVPVAHRPPSEKRSRNYPFLLNSGRILYQYHSSTMSRRSKPLTDFADRSYVLMHAADAASCGLDDGQEVRVVSPRGALVTRVKVSDQVAPGELFMPFHFGESPVNILTRDVLDPLSKIAPFKLTACRIEKRGPQPLA